MSQEFVMGNLNVSGLDAHIGQRQERERKQQEVKIEAQSRLYLAFLGMLLILFFIFRLMGSQ